MREIKGLEHFWSLSVRVILNISHMPLVLLLLQIKNITQIENYHGYMIAVIIIDTH